LNANFSQAIQISVELSEESGMLSFLNFYFSSSVLMIDHTNMVVPTAVYSAKFIEREQWLVAGDDDGDIYVYSYCTRQEVASFRGHHSRIESLAVHPSRPFIVSSSSHLIELWNWENNWECTHTFKEHSDRVTQITFNPVDTNSFASTSLDHTIKVCFFFVVVDVNRLF
jgi:coatomer subunit beta'